MRAKPSSQVSPAVCLPPVILLWFHFHLLPMRSSLTITGQGHWLLFIFLFTLLVAMAWKDISMGPQSTKEVCKALLFRLWVGDLPRASPLHFYAAGVLQLRARLWWGDTQARHNMTRGLLCPGTSGRHWNKLLYVTSQVTPTTSTMWKVSPL